VQIHQLQTNGPDNFLHLDWREVGRLCSTVACAAIVGVAGLYAQARSQVGLDELATENKPAVVTAPVKPTQIIVKKDVNTFAAGQIRRYDELLIDLKVRAETDQDLDAHTKFRSALDRFSQSLDETKEAASDAKQKKIADDDSVVFTQETKRENLRAQILELQDAAARAVAAAYDLDNAGEKVAGIRR
jgi:hypothetical protein